MHIVIISHYYPPLNAIASFRPASLAKYFAEKGIDVTVLTTHKDINEGSLDLDVFKHPRLQVVEVSYKQLQFWRKSAPVKEAAPLSQPAAVRHSGIKAILTKVRKWGVSCLGSLVDYQYFWTTKGIKAFSKIHRHKPVDIVISTFSPPAAHLIANAVIKKYPAMPWIADYRDLWSQRHIMTAKGVFKWIERYIEKKTIKRASYLTTVSEPLADKLRELVKGKVPVSVIYNGYDSQLDPERFTTVSMERRSMNIVYTGTIYEGRSDPSPLFQAITELESDGVLKEGDINISFYGNRMANLLQLMNQYKVHKWVELKGAVTHSEALLAQQQADFLLFLESNKPDARGVLTGKLFEYITTGKTILAIGVDEFCASAQVIRETQTGEVFSNDVNRIKNYVKQILIDKQEPARYPQLEMIAKYSRMEQSAKMLEIAKKILPSNH
jgi:glycosyltransferase involved in cell wall biosynthesis